MKYAILFVVVFALGFGVLQWSSGNDVEETTETVSASELIADSSEVETISTTTDLAMDTLFANMPDTFTYSKVDGYYDIQWKDLSRVKFQERMNEDLQVMVPYPIFHPSVKRLDAQKIQIKGYVIPFEETGDATIVILSAFPFSNCFFCGGAGAETVIDVQLKNQRTRFKQDAMVTFRGKLRLNDSDLDYLNYILDDAEIIK